MPYLIQTIHAQMYDEMKPGDMKKGAMDHGCDASRYLLMAREPLSDVPIDQRPGKTHAQRVGERTQKILDMVHTRHNQSLEMDDETAEAIVDELGIFAERTRRACQRVGNRRLDVKGAKRGRCSRR